MMRALATLALLLPLAANAQPAPQQPQGPSQTATLCGTLATNWATTLEQTDALRARVAELERQLATAQVAQAAPKPDPAHPP
jgi:hypothetical protein